MDEQNYILDELNNAKDGIKKHESDSFEELKMFEKGENNISNINDNCIIEFNKYSNCDFENIDSRIELAAESSVYPQDLDKSGFLISSDGKYMLKYTNQTNEEIHMSIISENEIDSNDAILYSPELNKYFVSNHQGDFVLNQYSLFERDLSNFKAFLPRDKISVFNNNGIISAISLSNYSDPKLQKTDNHFAYFDLNSKQDLSIFVIKSDNSKDFLQCDNGLVVVPLVLISGKTDILLY